MQVATAKASRGQIAGDEELQWLAEQRRSLQEQIMKLHREACLTADDVIEETMGNLKLQQQAETEAAAKAIHDNQLTQKEKLASRLAARREARKQAKAAVAVAS